MNKFGFVFLIISFFSIEYSSGQEFKRLEDINSTGTSFSIFAKKGEATVQILVLGTGTSGVFEVGVGTRLDQLLALVGGVTMESSSEEEVETTIRLYRENIGKRTMIYEAPLEQMLTEPGLYPALNEGDIFSMETKIIQKRKVTALEISRTIGAIASVVLLFDRFVLGNQ